MQKKEERNAKKLQLSFDSFSPRKDQVTKSKTKRSKNKDEDLTNKLYFEVQYNEFTGGTTDTAWVSSAQFESHGHLIGVCD